ncbi:MAG: dynamin family protein [Burkholderiaceae bacterium]
MGAFGERIAEYGGWRQALSQAVSRYGGWLEDAGLADPVLQTRLERATARLAGDRISIAFVAEYSRGKSELINAIFFADAGRRIVPSAAGRTTMCPTELLYDATRASSIRLLPIETRLVDTPLSELRSDDTQWHELPIDARDPSSLSRAFACVQETRWVDREQAELLGLLDSSAAEAGGSGGAGLGGGAAGSAMGAGMQQADEHGRVEIPRWRHAIVNVPHPLLELGLVIIDTPGLNAIGTEPELTLKLIPGADAVLFVLAADAGVTRTDIEVWRERISPCHDSGRFVVLNKIDSLWDELKDEVQIQLEIARQVGSVANTLHLPNERIFPVSAQKALVARVTGDEALEKRSRISDLEYALGKELVPQQWEIAREHVQREFDAVHTLVSGVLAARRRSAVEQLFELNGLRGKNRDVMDHFAARIRREREEFEQSLRHLQGLRAVFARHSQAIQTVVGRDTLRRHVRSARELMQGSHFSLGLREGMDSLIAAARTDLGEAARLVDEVSTLMSAMYRSFSAEHGLSLGNPVLFSVQRYLDELERIEQVQRRQFGAMSLLTTSQWALMRRFFESVAARIKDVYDLASREIQSWLRTVMAPIESQIREHQSQLRRRLDSVRRVLEANGSLEAKIGEVERQRVEVEQRIALADEFARQVRVLLEAPARERELAEA